MLHFHCDESDDDLDEDTSSEYNDDLTDALNTDDLSLDFRLGETLAIVGESGAGKSITALSAIRLLPNALEINEGSVTLEKDDIFELTENEMNEVRGRRIAMIFQGASD